MQNRIQVRVTAGCTRLFFYTVYLVNFFEFAWLTVTLDFSTAVLLVLQTQTTMKGIYFREINLADLNKWSHKSQCWLIWMLYNIPMLSFSMDRLAPQFQCQLKNSHAVFKYSGWGFTLHDSQVPMQRQCHNDIAHGMVSKQSRATEAEKGWPVCFFV